MLRETIDRLAFRLAMLLLTGTMLPAALPMRALHDFTGGSDGGNPQAGLAMDAVCNLAGTMKDAGGNNVGTAFEVTP